MSRKKPPVPSTLPGTDVALSPDLVPLLVPIGDVFEDPANPRITKNLAALVAKIRRFGFTDPIGVNASGMVEAGHQRLYACRELGATHIPRVRLGHSEIEALAYNIAHNRASEEVAAWDREALAPLLAKLQAEDAMESVGWEGDELAALLAGLESGEDEGPAGENGDGEPDEPDEPPPDPPADPVTKPGEVITLGRHVLHCADCMDVLRSLPDNSVDAIVTDPPYGLSPDGRARTWDDIERLRRQGKGPKSGFMGKDWDAGVPGITWARECLRVLKPGGHLIAFSSTRTVHRLTCAVEDAGFEIRDQYEWLYWQGFPKSHDVSKAIDEAAGVERPIVGRRTDGAGNGSVVGLGSSRSMETAFDVTAPATDDAKRWSGWGTALKPSVEPACFARKPLEAKLTVAGNVLKWGTGALNIDACRVADGDPAWPGPGEERDVKASAARGVAYQGSVDGSLRQAWHYDPKGGRWPANIYYCPKPSNSERNAGCDGLPLRAVDPDGAGYHSTFEQTERPNHHATVKPKKLFRNLLRLVTPPGGTVLEPFGGSGTTLVAAAGLDLRVIAVEREPAYCDIIRARAAE